MLNLKACKETVQLHYELLTLMVQFLKDDDLKHIEQTFMSMDQDNSGTIDHEELRNAYIEMREVSNELHRVESFDKV